MRNDIFTALRKAGKRAGPLSVAHDATVWFWQKAINIGVQGHWEVYALLNSETSLPKVYYKEIIQKKAKVVWRQAFITGVLKIDAILETV